MSAVVLSRGAFHEIGTVAVLIVFG